MSIVVNVRLQTAPIYIIIAYGTALDNNCYSLSPKLKQRLACRHTSPGASYHAGGDDFVSLRIFLFLNGRLHLLYCMSRTSPRQIPVYIQMLLATFCAVLSKPAFFLTLCVCLNCSQLAFSVILVPCCHLLA